MAPPRIGFIGFGEAAASIAQGLLGEGAKEIAAFDVRPRPAVEGVRMAESLAELMGRADVLFAAVTSAVALDVAKEAAPHLTPEHLYVDLNSVSPETKIAVGEVIAETGARYVEASVMAAVPPYQHKVPILLSGPAAPALIEAMAPFGMVMEDFGPELGRAAAVKMFRSVLVKGLEALLQECVLAADRYSVAERVLDSVADGYPGMDWNKLASYLIGRTALHGERRAHEMEEAVETLKRLGIDPWMSEAAARRLHWAAGFGLKETFGEKPPESFHEVLEAIRAAEGKAPGRKKA